MFRVRRKESPKPYSRIPRKSNQKTDFCNSRQIAGVEVAIEQVSRLNEIALQLAFSWTDLMTSTLDLETMFLEVLKTPRTTQLQVECVLS